VKENKNPGAEKLVTLEQFANVINWFGPISSTNKEGFLDDMKDIMKQIWFQGDITRKEAESMLFSASDLGAFLVRTSKSKANQPFAISKNANGGLVVHFRITKNSDGNFNVNDPTKKKHN